MNKKDVLHELFVKSNSVKKKARIKFLAEELGLAWEECDRNSLLLDARDGVISNQNTEIKHLRDLIDMAAKHWLSIDGIAWEGGIDEAMAAAVGEIIRLRESRDFTYNAALEDAAVACEKRVSDRLWVGVAGLAREVDAETKYCVAAIRDLKV